jgi:hypothetical protein
MTDKNKHGQPNEQADKAAKKPAAEIPPFKLTRPKQGQNPRIYTQEQAAADWKIVEARMEALGITNGF